MKFSSLIRFQKLGNSSIYQVHVKKLHIFNFEPMQVKEPINKALSADEIAVVRSLLYSAVFDYPLTEKELFENSTVSCSRNEFPALLNRLVEKSLLQKQGEFYFTNEGGDSTIIKRLKGNAGAASMMDTAYRYSRKIASFPFVRGICLSGALSKNYYDEKGDIDYFIITEPGRLWICRSLLILRYKLLPKNKKKFWCVNYFVSADNLEIPDKNAFTSTELAHLIPAFNYKAYTDLLDKNEWYRKSFPNKGLHSDSHCLEVRPSFFKRLIESLFSIGGNTLDDLLLRVTLKRWQKKYPDLRTEDFELQFRSRKNVCKRHTMGFQNKVLNAWGEKQKAFELSHGIRL
jgi:hypothetical protein